MDSSMPSHLPPHKRFKKKKPPAPISHSLSSFSKALVVALLIRHFGGQVLRSASFFGTPELHELHETVGVVQKWGVHHETPGFFSLLIILLCICLA